MKKGESSSHCPLEVCLISYRIDYVLLYNLIIPFFLPLHLILMVLFFENIFSKKNVFTHCSGA